VARSSTPAFRRADFDAFSSMATDCCACDAKLMLFFTNQKIRVDC
jgi:hypothetical protein